MLTTTIPADLAGRRAAFTSNPSAPPSGAEREQHFDAEMRSQLVEKDGKTFIQLDGTASVVERWYEMWDFFGVYEEKVARGAFDETLAQSPDVSFLLNHKGMTMARTKARTLEVFTNDAGDLVSRAFLNPERTDCIDLKLAIDDGNITEMSFAFRIVEWMWNEDYSQFTITKVDLERGDVSAVNYGANPFTSIAARAKQAFESIDALEGPALAAARARLDARVLELGGDVTPVPPVADPAAAGTSLALARLRESVAS